MLFISIEQVGRYHGNRSFDIWDSVLSPIKFVYLEVSRTLIEL